MTRRLGALLGYFASSLLIASLSAQVSAPAKVDVRDEGTSQGRVGAINFTGAPVTATVSGDVATVNITAGGGSSATEAVLCCLTDGLARFTITDGTVTSSSKVMITIRRPDVEDVDDHGWLFIANVVKVGTGSFDVLIQVLGQGGDELLADPPAGSFSLYYMVS
jgi:hypothetical protein